MNRTRAIMAFLSSLTIAGAVKWAVNEWKNSTPGKQGWILGITIATCGVGVLALLRAFNLF